MRTEPRPDRTTTSLTATVTPVEASEARSVDQLITALAAGSRAKYLPFWGHRQSPDGRLGPSCLSQWWPSRFAAEGEVFRSAEHYMMLRKALLFQDQARADSILSARSPAQAKAIGRQVVGFDEVVWVKHGWDIVVSASESKFGSDPSLRKFLLGTGRRVLVEASPVDRIWGIGLAADSEFAEVPQRWRGQNLLGFALMEARKRLSDG